MKFKIRAQVILVNEYPDELCKVLEPENQTMKDGSITTRIAEHGVVSDIVGTMKVGTLLNTVDDLLKTAILFDNVSESAE